MDGPTNPHLSDPNLRPFLSSDFSPTTYLNTHLPTPPPAASKSQQSNPSLSTLASQTHSHISTLNAQQTRLSNTLTDLTDDILRTSSRLAYEVELLRGEAVSLAETLSTQGPLNDAIQKFVPNGIGNNAEEHNATTNGEPDTQTKANEPPALSQLRTLHAVRTQLQRVVQIFNLALAFPLPPSLLSTPASSLISVQPPNVDPNAENKAQAALANLKTEIVDLMRIGNIAGAQEKVRNLREVCGVWKETQEEKERVKWVEGLEVLVGLREDERKKMVGQKQDGIGRREGSVGRERGMGLGLDGGQSRSSTPAAGIGSGGFLKRLRDEIYLDSS